MIFRTEINIPASELKLSHKDKIFCIGSCFAENIFDKLKYFGFDVSKSSFGIVFNPIVISNQLNIILDRSEFSLSDYIFSKENIFLSWLHHSKIYSEDNEGLLSMISSELQLDSSNLNQANLLIITLGSSFYYFHNELNIPVANCHKENSQIFTKKETEVDVIYGAYSKLILNLLNNNPNLRILFTVSPVRYLKDGFVENSRSKAKLILAIEKLQKEFSSVYYFPAYEIFIDDLRDYRFVKSDLVHPNDLAIDYIWNKFSELYFDQITIKTMAELKKIRLLHEHRPIHPTSKESQILIERTRILEEEFIKKHPEVSL